MKGDRKRRKGHFRLGHDYHPISQNVKSEHTFTDDIVPFQRLEPSEIDAVLNRPFETPRTLDEALADTNPTTIRLLRPKKETALKVEENNEPADDTR